MKTIKPKVNKQVSEPGTPGTVEIRMYCMGTGDCFVLRFFKEDSSPFTIMIDCGSCRGNKIDFAPYIEDLAAHVRSHIDLLIVTHEHQDHVNGFQKCNELFQQITINNVWFAWTEDPDDPTGQAAELRKKKKEMKSALNTALKMIQDRQEAFGAIIESSPFSAVLQAGRDAFVGGLKSLSEINLDETTATGNETEVKALAGMAAVKKLAKEKNARISYLMPGTTVKIPELPGINFHILGPPVDRKYVYMDGKEGRDVYRKAMDMGFSSYLAKAFTDHVGESKKADIPFNREFVLKTQDPVYQNIEEIYRSPDNNWRNIDDEWLMGAGLLAIRLNSHINNTSLAIAVEAEQSRKVLLLPGDAEYGSWESWHAIKAWEKKGSDGKKHLVEDLLNRTVFYKVGHHLSYNGTALEKGIQMMPENNLVAFATLDRMRISEGWKSTMPNKHLLEELTRRTAGCFFIMNEEEIASPPSKVLDPLGDSRYQTAEKNDGSGPLYKQYTLDI